MSLRLVSCLMLCLFALTVPNFSSVACSSGILQDNSPPPPPAPEATKEKQDVPKQEPKPDVPKPDVPKPEVAKPEVAKPDVPKQDSTTVPKKEPKQESETAKKPSKPEEEKPKPEPAAVDKKTSPFNSSELLPPSTRAWVSIPDMNRLEAQFDKTQIGKLLEDEQVKPFFEAGKTQLKDFLDEKNLRVGLRIDDILEVRSGEVCIAGVLQDLEGGQPARGSHGLVLLVDVTDNEPKTKEILVKLNLELQKKNGGTIEQIKINEMDVTKLSSQNPKRIRQDRNILQTIKNGWLLVADNEEIFRDILRRLNEPEKIDKAATLSNHVPFVRVMKETELFGGQAELSWFVDPFGYLELAKKLYEEEQAIKQHREDWAGKLEAAGFDSVKGIGGNLGMLMDVKEQKLESLSRMFILAPRENVGEREKRFFDMFDFSDAKPGAPDPNAMISDNAAAFFGGSWQFTKLLWSIEPIADSLMGGDGEYRRMLEDFKKEPDFQVDIPRLVGMLDDQLFVFSATEKPISSASERMAIGIRLKNGADTKYIFEKLRKMAKGSTVIVLAGKDVIESDTTKIEEEDEFDVPGVDTGFDDGLDEDPDDAGKKPRFSLFEKRYMTIQNGILIVSNDKQYMRQLLSGAPKVKMAEAADYLRIKEALNKLTDSKNVRFRRFVRLDRIFEVNYHIIRQGQMASSPTMIGRLLNRIYESDDQNAGQVRKQRLDGSLLPEDYNANIAPFLGPTGWVIEVEPDGWRITGCLINK